MPQALKEQMDALVKWIKERVQGGDETHEAIMHEAAGRFDLYDDEGLAPVWLSRVVEGEMRDATFENENYDFRAEASVLHI